MKRLKLKRSAKVIILLVISGLFCICTSVIYLYLASPVDRDSTKNIKIEIKSGMSSREIASLLERKKLIRNGTFFLIYSKLNKCDSLKASTYEFNKSMSLNTIFELICKGDYNKDNITITFKEGKRVTDYAKLIADKTDNSYDEVISIMQDRNYIAELVDKYWFLTNDILDEDIYYPLEGYLYPDTYKFNNKKTQVKEIIKIMLDETDKKISPYKDKIKGGKHSIHEYITLASMAELEGTNSDNRKKIVGVFENRLKIGMSLGSDVTTYYALQKPMTSDLTTDEFNTVNPYNTRNINMKGLPVGPIASITINTLLATIDYIESDNYYFVADKNGNIYFTKNAVEHEKKVRELKESGDWIW